jgi:DNA ligase-associated metallophosphoesterase
VILSVSETTLQLLPELAAFDPSTRTLFVADLHLGKAAAFRAAGVPLPDGSDAETLNVLSLLIRRVEARQLVILGDVFHDRLARRESLQRLLTEWLAEHRGLILTIVPGNHDRRIVWEEWFPDAVILAAGSPLGTCAVYHHPPEEISENALALCGHLHPGISLSRKGVRGVTTPCFRLRQNVLVLPAFGRFTGLSMVPRTGESRIFVSLRKTVVEVPASA